MTIEVPTAGQPILDSWGQDVANKLNRVQLPVKSSDQSTNSATAVDIAGLSFDVEAGKKYVAKFIGLWSGSATNQGLQLKWTEPTGTTSLAMLTIRGKTSRTSLDYTHTGGAGLNGVSSCNTADDRVFFEIEMVCEVTTAGTIQLQFARGGTSGGTGITIYAGTGGIVVADS